MTSSDDISSSQLNSVQKGDEINEAPLTSCQRLIYTRPPCVCVCVLGGREGTGPNILTSIGIFELSFDTLYIWMVPTKETAALM